MFESLMPRLPVDINVNVDESVRSYIDVLRDDFMSFQKQVREEMILPGMENVSEKI